LSSRTRSTAGPSHSDLCRSLTFMSYATSARHVNGECDIRNENRQQPPGGRRWWWWCRFSPSPTFPLPFNCVFGSCLTAEACWFVSRIASFPTTSATPQRCLVAVSDTDASLDWLSLRYRLRCWRQSAECCWRQRFRVPISYPPRRIGGIRGCRARRRHRSANVWGAQHLSVRCPLFRMSPTFLVGTCAWSICPLRRARI
jgi:hypothetical protein